MQPSAPARYFAGRVPDAYVSSESDNEAKPSPKPPVTSRPRKRFQARVLPSAEASATRNTTADAAVRRPTNPTGAFVSVSKLKQGHVRVVSDDSSEGQRSSSSESESQSPSVASQEIVEEEEAEEEEDSFIPKPVFIKKGQRVSSAKLDQEEAAQQQERDVQRKQRRREEAQGLVSAILTEEDRRPEWNGMERLHAELPDDEDRPEDAEAEYELWKQREIKRILRDREAERIRLAGGKDVEQDNEEQESVQKPEAQENTSDGKRKVKVGPFFLEKGKDGRYAEEIYNRTYDAPVNRISNRVPLSKLVLRGEPEDDSVEHDGASEL